MMSRRLFLATLAAAGVTAALSGPFILGAPEAWAQSKDELIAAGTAGERWDGYMEARDASVAGAVASINAQRKQVYAKRAAEQGVPVEEVGKVYAQEIIGRLPSGAWIKRPSGDWVRK